MNTPLLLEIHEMHFPFQLSILKFQTPRYVCQLLTPAITLARKAGRSSLAKDDVIDTDELFHDAKSSAKLLADKCIS